MLVFTLKLKPASRLCLALKTNGGKHPAMLKASGVAWFSLTDSCKRVWGCLGHSSQCDGVSLNIVAFEG